MKPAVRLPLAAAAAVAVVLCAASARSDSLEAMITTFQANDAPPVADTGADPAAPADTAPLRDATGPAAQAAPAPHSRQPVPPDAAAPWQAHAGYIRARLAWLQQQRNAPGSTRTGGDDDQP